MVELHESEIPPEAMQYFEVSTPPTVPAIVYDCFHGKRHSRRRSRPIRP